MDTSASFFRGLAILLIGLVILGWILYRWLRSSQDDPGRLILKWVLSGLIVVFLLVPVGKALTTSGPGGAFLLPVIAVGGLLLAIIWTPSITNWFGSKVEALYTGGNQPPDPEPFYSKAQGLRKRGHYQEAAQEVAHQLEMFPRDVTGHLLLAEIQADDLKDMTAAHDTILSFCDQPDHTPQNTWLALNFLADFYLKHEQDVTAASHCLQMIVDRLPDTPQATRAAQRLGHMASPESLAQAQNPSPIELKPGVRNVGLLKNSSHLKAPEKDPEEQASQLINQLEMHPLDSEAREQLASLYASYYHDLDLAQEQLEILLGQPTQPHKNMVRWLNLLADYQLNLRPELPAIRNTLQRIMDLNPNLASATLAQQRLAYLQLELKGKEKSRAIPLGSDSKANPDGDA